MFTESYPRRFSIQIHHSGEFSNQPKRVYKFAYTDNVDLIDCDTFSMYVLVKILADIGLGDNEQKLFIHFRVPSLNLDDGLVPLMSDQDVKLLLNFVPRYKEVDVFVETDVSLVEKQLFEHTCWRKASKGIVIKEILQDDVGRQVVPCFEDDLFQQDDLDRPESCFGDRPEDVALMFDEYLSRDNRDVNDRNTVQEVDEEVVEREQPDDEEACDQNDEQQTEGDVSDFEHAARDMPTPDTPVDMGANVEGRQSLRSEVVNEEVEQGCKVKLPKVVENSVSILTDGGLGMAMFSIGLFMASHPRIVACGTRLAFMAMVLKFIIRPEIMGAPSIILL
ncbi:auxin efflux carrier family protein [Artemisia annua]|uniref:Auxin efflux carrier family protein n=1 Tax=Artemisia annua TaxID=35608 RepID=A0A2U1KV33_ARTAN|nr:auxin efflux carrier family protein [Artemisia annua]